MNLQSLFLLLILAAAFGAAAREVSRVWPPEMLALVLAASSGLCGIVAAVWAAVGRNRRRAWWLYSLVGVLTGGFAAILVLLPPESVNRTAWVFAGMNVLMIFFAAATARKSWRDAKTNAERSPEGFDGVAS